MHDRISVAPDPQLLPQYAVRRVSEAVHARARSRVPQLRPLTARALLPFPARAPLQVLGRAAVALAIAPRRLLGYDTGGVRHSMSVDQLERRCVGWLAECRRDDTNPRLLGGSAVDLGRVDLGCHRFPQLCIEGIAGSLALVDAFESIVALLNLPHDVLGEGELPGEGRPGELTVTRLLTALKLHKLRAGRQQDQRS